MGLAWNGFGRPKRRACTSTLRSSRAPGAPDVEAVGRLIRSVAADFSALEEASALRRRQIPGPTRWLDPANEALARASVRLLGGLNDLRAALAFARVRDSLGTRDFAARAGVKMASARAELENLGKRSPEELSAFRPAESVLEVVTVALRAIEATTADLQEQLS